MSRFRALLTAAATGVAAVTAGVVVSAPSAHADTQICGNYGAGTQSDQVWTIR